MFAPLVSIVIPVYNGSNYLREAVDSALAQTYLEREVIIVNDGSTDGGATEAVARSYGEAVRYLAKPNGGVASALNMGIAEMRGEYFSWLSHDDVYLPDKLERQVAFLAALPDPRVLLYSDCNFIDASGKVIGTCLMPDTAKDEVFVRIWGSSFLNGCTMLIPRIMLIEARGFNESLRTVQDYDLWFRLARKATFCRCPGVVLLSRQHAAQGSRLHAHKRECAELLGNYVPDLLNSIRHRQGGFAKAAPLLVHGITQRVVTYGLVCARRLYVAFIKNALPEEKRQLIPFLLRQLPYVCLLWVWLRIPMPLRTRLRGWF